MCSVFSSADAVTDVAITRPATTPDNHFLRWVNIRYYLHSGGKEKLKLSLKRIQNLSFTGPLLQQGNCIDIQYQPAHCLRNNRLVLRCKRRIAHTQQHSG